MSLLLCNARQGGARFLKQAGDTQKKFTFGMPPAYILRYLMRIFYNIRLWMYQRSAGMLR